ncbi:NUDIX hydrolase [Rhodopseudomonas sp. BR0M22]|uniref:NUDIX hydrolase n=1 Tax=Rhodopseudomonas sp. BR0M22 TaxID=2269369 RepID=UPI0013DF023E|nr:NUDIX hydrolase [Rhodopseudomonas sp. BR0M22]
MIDPGPVTIHRVNNLDLWVSGFVWPFADKRRADIDAHFAERQVAQPKLWNGRVLLGRQPRFDGGSFSAEYFEVDYASFLSWRDWEFPDPSVFNGFGMGVIRAADGAIVLGEMGAHTANAGKVYFAGGTPDLSDVRNHRLDIAASVTREVKEETGLVRSDYRAADHWHCVEAGPLVAMLRILDVYLPSDALKARIEAYLAREQEPEFTRVHLVRSKDDFLPTMPRFVTTYLTMLLSGDD